MLAFMCSIIFLFSLLSHKLSCLLRRETTLSRYHAAGTVPKISCGELEC